MPASRRGTPKVARRKLITRAVSMRFIVFLEDLSEEMRERIYWALREELKEEIEQAVKSGIARETAEQEIIDDYLNRHNVGSIIEL